MPPILQSTTWRCASSSCPRCCSSWPAKTIKEAQTYVTPLMILSMVVGVTAMFGGGASAQLWAYFIPFYNSVQVMVGIFALELNWTYLLIAVASNLVYTAIGVWGLTRMFNSEKIMFQR